MAHPAAHRWGDSVINTGEIPVIVGILNVVVLREHEFANTLASPLRSG